MPGGTAAMVTLLVAASADLRGEGEHSGGGARVARKQGDKIAGRYGERAAAPAGGEGDGGIGGTQEIQRGCTRAAGLRRSVEADGQRALLCAGRLLEVQRDDGVGQ